MCNGKGCVVGFTSGEMMESWQYWSHKSEYKKYLVKSAELILRPVLACPRVCTCWAEFEMKGRYGMFPARLSEFLA